MLPPHLRTVSSGPKITAAVRGFGVTFREDGADIIDRRCLWEMVQRARGQEYAPGEVIIQQGAVGNEYFVCIAGSCLVVIGLTDAEEGSKLPLDKLPGTTVAELGEGQGFGETAFLSLDSTRSAAIVAGQAGARCLVIHREDYLAAVANRNARPTLPALHAACLHHRLDEVQQLVNMEPLESTVAVLKHLPLRGESQQYYGLTALHAALVAYPSHGAVAVLTELLNAGADSSAVDKSGDRPVHYVCQHDSRRSIALLNLLIEHGADTSAISGKRQSCLHIACGAGAVPLVQLLLELGPAEMLRLRDLDLWLPLHCASAGSTAAHGQIAELLLERTDADVCCAADRSGCSAFHLAVCRPWEEASSWESELAIGSAGPMDLVFEALDTNMDGVIDKEEFEAILSPKSSFRASATSVMSRVDSSPSSHDEKHSEQLANLMADWLRERQLLAGLVDSRGCTMIEAALATGGPNRTWGLMYNATLGRYSKIGDRPTYVSATSEVWHAIDRIDGDKEVALKILTSRDFFESEVLSRRGLDPQFVVGLLRVHVSEEDYGRYQNSLDSRWPVAPEQTKAGEFMLVMEWCDRSLHEATFTERIAGYDVPAIVSIARSMAEGLQHMHAHNLIHGDVKKRNVLRTDSGRWLLTDFDAAVALGRPTAHKYSEAHVPPEYMLSLLHEREVMGPGIHDGHPTIQATPQFDIWAFGTVLYELVTGTNLLARDVNNDTCATIRGCHTLAAFVELGQDQLELVLPQCTNQTVRLLAQDLVGILLSGKPKHRPSSFTQVLQHPFFSGDIPSIPTVPTSISDVSGCDVIFSYQSRNEALLRRLRRTLALIGLKTVDGLQVSPGSDWRSWYFGHCAAASCFLVLHSESWLQSAACQEELAYALAEVKPIEAISVDNTPAIDGMPSELPGEDTNGFEREFFTNLRVLVERIMKHLPSARPALAHLLCVEPDAIQFANSLEQALSAAGVHAAVHHPDSKDSIDPQLLSEAVLMPVLSGPLLESAMCTELLVSASEQSCALLPVLYAEESYSKVAYLPPKEISLIEDSSELDQAQRQAIAISQVKSILNRCNRIPSNRDYQPGDLTLLVQAVKNTLALERGEDVRLARRLPKLSALLHSLPCVLPSQSAQWRGEYVQNFNQAYTNNLRMLIDQLHSFKMNQQALVRGPHSNQPGPSPLPDNFQGVTGVFSHAGDASSVTLAARLRDDLAELNITMLGVETNQSSVYDRYYAMCERASLCIPLLSADFARSVKCEAQFTYAKDCRLWIVPCVASDDWYALMHGA